MIIIFLEINKVSDYLILKDIYKTIIEINYKQDLKFLENSSYEKIINTAFKLVHFGWNKEAIPITQPEKSRLARFFDALFG